jgi:DNA sulfur modification protein DndB
MAELSTGAVGGLKVPGLRAHMGDWIYYITFLRLEDIAQRVSLAQDLHTSKALKDLIQREVDESVHSQAIKRYLLEQEQRLFNAIVIAIYGGAPTWAELKIDDTAKSGLGVLPSYMKGALGVLAFDGSEKLFAVDGQHRVVGIQKAVATESALGDEEVCVRRLFTTLNRYAKPVNKTEIIALDEDDAIAIVTRRLLENYPLLTNFTSIKRGKSIPASDRRSLTTIVTVYDVLDRYMSWQWKDRRDFKKQRPGDRHLNNLYKQAVALFEGLKKAFPPLSELADSRPDEEVSFKYRNRSAGGHLLFRPVGLLMVVSVIRYLLDEGRTLAQALSAVALAPMLLAEAPWAGLLWDSANHRMTVSSENQRVAIRLLLHGVGGRLGALKNASPETLKREWAGIIDKPAGSVRLPSWK